MSPERKICLDSLLQAGQPHLLNSSSFGLRKWLIHDIGQGWSAPEDKRCAQ
jgi:hypothetical protein